MNARLLCKLLGILSLLVGAFMLFSMPWAFPNLGQHTQTAARATNQVYDPFETEGFRGLLISMLISFGVAGILLWLGRGNNGKLFRKEAMAAVGLSWILATFLGALPYYFSGVYRGPAVRVHGPDYAPQIATQHNLFRTWEDKTILDSESYHVVQALAEASARGLSLDELIENSGVLECEKIFYRLKESTEFWNRALIGPGDDSEPAPADRASNFRVRWMRMGVVDCLFESQSGFSTTGATVINDLEDPIMVPHCLLFWRSSTHFLGGLGIIVLFVAILGQGSAGKALMRTEMPGPTQEGSTARMQHTAWRFAIMYIVLNIVLVAILFSAGMNLFDATCHAFGTMATGGFSTYNASLGHFDSALIEYVVIVFMILAGTNFTLLLLVTLGKPKNLFSDIEWRTYIAIILVVAGLVVFFGMMFSDKDFENIPNAIRYGLFQVVSIVTTTGFGTSDYDSWNQFARAALLTLMFVGGCAGSTGGGMKVIRHVLFFKVLWLELERAFHPRIVRRLRIGGKPVEDQNLARTILVYFGLVLVLFIGSWLFVVTIESENTWGGDSQHKLIDCASAVASTLNNIGPGLGTVGPTQNYSQFSSISKLLFVLLMMLGRLEVYVILVMFLPSFWRDG